MFKRLIRSHAVRRRVSWAIAAVLILPLVIFFHVTGQGTREGPGGVAGKIFGKAVPWERFQEQYQWSRTQVERQIGKLPDEWEPLLYDLAWERLIQLEEARRRRLRVDDEELAAFIRQIPAFQEDGRFLPERYHRYLSATGLSPQTFEQLLRSDLLLERLTNAVTEAVTVSDEEVRAAYADQHAQLRATLILFEPAAYAAQAAAGLTEDEVRAAYQASLEELLSPEQIVIQYVGRSRDELMAQAQVQVNEEELERPAQNGREQPEGADGVTTPQDDVEGSLRQELVNERIRKRLAALRLDLEEDVEAGRSLEEIAAARSLSLRSAGPLPVDGRGGPEAPDPPVLEAAASLPEGQLTEVIQTDSGVYLARVTRRTPPRLPTFDEARETVRQRRLQERARAAANAHAEALAASLSARRAAGLRFEEAALALGPLPAKPVTFTRTGPIEPIGASPSVNEAAFATPLGELTAVLETSHGFVILRPEERLPADEAQFAATQDALRQATLTQKRSLHLEEWRGNLRDRAKLQSFLETPS